MIISPRSPHVPSVVVTAGVSPTANSDGATKADARAPGPATLLTAKPPGQLLAPKLTIEFDDAAGRFVQTLIDPTNQSVLRRFPAEYQLAFSRGVNAYMAALLRA